MDGQLSEEALGEAIETDNITNIYIKYESETEAKHHSETFPINDELEATIKLENCDILHSMEHLVKSELVEFDEKADDVLNETAAATTMVLLEKMPKTEAEILGDYPTSASDEEFDNKDSGLNSDPEHDPFADADVGGDPDLFQNPQISHSGSYAAAAAAAAQYMQTNHRDPTQLCSICNQLFTSAQSYIFHALKIHGTNEAMSTRYSFECQFCTSCFPSNEALNAHVTSCHESNKTSEPYCELKPLKCQLCPSAYTNQIELTNHIMQSHKNRPRFKCSMPNCEEAFSFNGRLQNHLAKDHSKERSFKCQEPNCGKTFKINGQLQRHMLLHLEERPFKCPHSGCHETFKINELLTKHFKIHTKASPCVEVATGPFKCGQCERPFTKKLHLNMHFKSHQKKIFYCPHPNCDRKFNYKKNCNSHFTYKHSSGDTVPPQCPDRNFEKTLENKHSFMSRILDF